MNFMKKPIEEMNLDEAIAEFQHLDSYFMKCKEIGQGINSKESCAFLLAADRIYQLDQINPTWSEYYQADPPILALVHRNRIEAIKKGRSQLQKAG